MDALYPPGPQKSLILGDAPHFKHNPLDFMAEAARAYGDLVHFRFGPAHAYLLTNPRDAHYVLVERSDLFCEQVSFLRALNSAMGHDLFPPKDTPHKWPLRRGKFQPVWLDDQVETMAQTAAQALGNWKGDEAPLEALMEKLVAGSLFGQAEPKAITNGMATALAALRDDAHFRSPLTLPDCIPTRANRQHTQAASDLQYWTQQALAEYKSSPTLFRLIKAAGHPLFAGEELIALFRAGRFAVAKTVAQAWALLAAHPETADALETEIASVLGNRLPTDDDLPNLAYCEMVIKETLRLHPPVSVISRQTRKEAKLGSYFAPAGSTIFVSPYIIHHSPKYYASPETFLPERFCDSFARRDRNAAYMPFGAGTYTETARDYAVMLGKLVLAVAVVQRGRSQGDTGKKTAKADVRDTQEAVRPQQVASV